MSPGPEQSRPSVDSNESSESQKVTPENLNIQDEAASKTDELNKSVSSANEQSEDELIALANNTMEETAKETSAPGKTEKESRKAFTRGTERAEKRNIKISSPEGRKIMNEEFDNVEEDLTKGEGKNIVPPSKSSDSPSKQPEAKRQQETVDDIFSNETNEDGSSNRIDNAEKVLKIEQIKDPKERAKQQKQYIAGLKEKGLTDEQAQKVYKSLSGSAKVTKELVQLKKDRAAFKAAPEKFEEYLDIVESGDKEALDKFIKENGLEENFNRLDAVDQLATEVMEIQEVRAAEAKLDSIDSNENRENQSRMDSMGLGNVYAELSPEGKDAIDGLMEGAGDGLVVSTFLAGAEIVDGAIKNVMAGAEIALDFATGLLSMVGHHEGDRAFAGKIPINPPTVPVFNNVYQDSIARQDANNYLLNNSQLADGMARMIGNFDPEGGALVTADQINRYHNYQNILLGAGKETSQEQSLFKTLGVIADSGAVNLRRMFMVGQAMRLYIDDSMDHYKQHGSGVINSEDLVTLTNIWDNETEFTLGDPKSFPSPLDLKDLTKERLDFENA